MHLMRPGNPANRANLLCAVRRSVKHPNRSSDLGAAEYIPSCGAGENVPGTCRELAYGRAFENTDWNYEEICSPFHRIYLIKVQRMGEVTRAG